VWIAYQTNRSGHEGVWLVHPDGSDDHEIALDVPGERLHPDWSPDGTQLVITSRTERDVLYSYDVESDTARVLWDCASPCVGDDEAVWSPDGERIAFVRAMEPFNEGVPSCALFVGDVQSGTVEQLGETVSCFDRETFPHWSRDGSRIAYYRGVYEGDTVESTAIYVFDVSTGTETKVTEDAMFAGDSDWSADGEWLTFSTYPLNDFQCCEVSNLYRIHPDGSGLEQITQYDTPDLRATQPRYTPDGNSIIFTAVSPDARLPWVIPADGGEPVAVSSSGIYTHNAWQPAP
jgi:Tol biopolymer transport system component